MAKRIDVSDLDIFYGTFKAVEGVSLHDRAVQRHRLHRARPAAASPPCCAA